MRISCLVEKLGTLQVTAPLAWLQSSSVARHVLFDCCVMCGLQWSPTHSFHPSLFSVCVCEMLSADVSGVEHAHPGGLLVCYPGQ